MSYPSSRVSTTAAQDESVRRAPAPRHAATSGAGGAGEAAAEELALPAHLVTETRTAWRQTLLEHVERALTAADARGATPTAVLLDLRETVEVDASGLGILVFAQRRAREAGAVVRLLHASEPVRRLLILTKLDHLFEFAG